MPLGQDLPPDGAELDELDGKRIVRLSRSLGVEDPYLLDQELPVLALLKAWLVRTRSMSR